MPDMPALLEAGYKKAKLRAHSDYYPNEKVNAYALSFLQYADIMCESKMKNLASIKLLNQYNKYLTEGDLWQDTKPELESLSHVM